MGRQYHRWVFCLRRVSVLLGQNRGGIGNAFCIFSRLCVSVPIFMPVTWTLIGGILTLRIIGHHVLADSQLAVSEALTDPRFTSGTPLLVDGRAALINGLTVKEIQAVAAWLTSLPMKGFSTRMALVRSKRGSLSGDTSAVGSVLKASGITSRVFETPELAIEWLEQTVDTTATACGTFSEPPKPC
jgi:hypothetical protein